MKKITISAMIVITVLSMYMFGYNSGQENGYKQGYSRGMVDLSLDITQELNITVSNKTLNSNFTYFKDIQDITLYIYKKHGLKTIAIWE